ncbi:TPA: hypothetical protein N0F65_000344 [Lagenidium giganteum]|uniref:Tc1-like transposase DDE domain-containing protein n=1 Tax=Lagenidium giganteum TaxID=4803 RepID=A0AAV2YF73_9STRA|nr:TPA: hypothetical protein N0F65_000344 [Lagenidium giganteum]
MASHRSRLPLRHRRERGRTSLRVSVRSVVRWQQLFQENGKVLPRMKPKQTSRLPKERIAFVNEYVQLHPCFYLEEMQEAVRKKFPSLRNTSTATICRLLRFDLNLSKKVLAKRARGAVPTEVRNFFTKLAPFYSGPDQMVFLDETSKDVVQSKIAPMLNPWPLPRSIVVIDNAKIQMYTELEDVDHQRGALIFFLPPYSPHLNPIELGFSLLKRWIRQHAAVAFRFDAERPLQVAMQKWTEAKQGKTENLFIHYGYGENAWVRDLFVTT